ncbi:MAG: response regulator [Blastocatellia bacterium]|nr:response regulator [Blastocatellia bacterium]
MANLHLISVVDDDDSVRESLQGLIRSLGFAVEVFAMAEEFLNSDQLGKTDCVILDVRMPGMNGLELQRRLIGRGIPVIFITSHEDEMARLQALKNGAVDYLFKPFSEEALLKAIHAAFNAKEYETNKK